jgi:hypothetical protein
MDLLIFSNKLPKLVVQNALALVNLPVRPLQQPLKTRRTCQQDAFQLVIVRYRYEDSGGLAVLGHDNRRTLVQDSINALNRALTSANEATVML